MDHWDAGVHKHERRSLIKQLQQYCAEQEVRITFLSGDVHCCAAGRMYSKPKVRPPDPSLFNPAAALLCV